MTTMLTSVPAPLVNTPLPAPTDGTKAPEVRLSEEPVEASAPTTDMPPLPAVLSVLVRATVPGEFRARCCSYLW